ncbi:MAG: hypothetical protein EBR45_08735 [Betaproteobacteria bacterium]|nr:hypothetical protein [Betaproteobacteria bacterium]
MLYSIPHARAPNCSAAAIAILPSPAPRSTTSSVGVCFEQSGYQLVSGRQPHHILADLPKPRGIGFSLRGGAALEAPEAEAQAHCVDKHAGGMVEVA